jgi:hypothetical protein
METGKKQATKSFIILLLILLISGICRTAFAEPRVIYVDTNASGANNGTSWKDAYNYLQDALEDANITPGCEEIWVAQGIYRPDEDSNHPSGSGDREATFQLESGVSIYGGFAGDETSRDQRDWVANQTILSGDIDARGDVSDNSYHVIVGVTDAALDGFTITGGNANGGGNKDNGGGMFNYDCSPTVTNCTFSGNEAWHGGGGICDYNSSLMVTNCTFSGNSALDGGGMYNENGNPTVRNCTFNWNLAWVSDSYNANGGGMYNKDGSPTVTNCTFSGNEAWHGGGGNM